MQKWQYGNIKQTRGYGGTIRGGFAKDWELSGVSKVLAQYQQGPNEHPLTIADRAGEDGWELVTVVAESGFGGSESSGFTSERIFYFKRLKP